MKERTRDRIRRWLSQPLPVRRESTIATWWEWGGRAHRVRAKAPR